MILTRASVDDYFCDRNSLLCPYKFSQKPLSSTLSFLLDDMHSKSKSGVKNVNGVHFRRSVTVFQSYLSLNAKNAGELDGNRIATGITLTTLLRLETQTRKI